MTMAFANEWAGKGVNVNAIAPGYINKTPTSMKGVYILDWGMKKNTALKLLGHSQNNNMRYKMRANKTGDLEIYDSEQD